MPTNADVPDTEIVGNLQSHARNVLQAVNDRMFDTTQYPWTAAADNMKTINPTGGRPPASSKTEALNTMQQICEAFPEHQIRVLSLSTDFYTKQHARYASVFVNGEVSGAPGLAKGIWRPMVTVFTYQRIGGEWICISEESIDGVGGDDGLGGGF